MTQYYEDDPLIGAFADPRSADLVDDLDNYLRVRLSQAPLARSTTVYYGKAAAGDGSGSDADNKRSWLFLPGDLAAASDDTAFLLERGQTYTPAAGYAIPDGLDHVTIGAWGSGGAPRITNYAAISGTWTQAGSTNRWSQTVGKPGWVKDQKYNGLSPYVLCTSTAEVEAIERSFYYDGADLHINPGDGIDPNGITIEGNAAATSNDDGIYVGNCDGVRIDGLLLDGWGCTHDNPDQFYPIRVGAYGERLCVVTNCQGFDCGRHSISQNVQGTSNPGGIMVIVNCEGGYGASEGTSVNCFNGYNGAGENEFVVAYSRARFGIAPQALFEGLPAYGGVQTPYVAAYGHTSLSDNVRLHVAFRCETGTGEGIPTATRPGGFSGAANVPAITAADPSTWSACRSLVVDCVERMDVVGNLPNDATMWGYNRPDTIKINCRYLRLNEAGVQNLSKSLIGVQLNPLYVIESHEAINRLTQSDAEPGVWAGAAVLFRSRVTGAYAYLVFNDTGAAGSHVVNSILSADTPYVHGFRLESTGNVFPTLDGNAYFNRRTVLPHGDANGVDLSHPMTPTPLEQYAELRERGVASSFMPEFDIDWRPRGVHPSIGPWEQSELPNVGHVLKVQSITAADLRDAIGMASASFDADIAAIVPLNQAETTAAALSALNAKDVATAPSLNAVGVYAASIAAKLPEDGRNIAGAGDSVKTLDGVIVEAAKPDVVADFVPSSRTWKLGRTRDAVGPPIPMTVGESQLVAMDFSDHLPTNGSVKQIDDITIEALEDGGDPADLVASELRRGVDRTLGKVELTPAAGGTYEVTVAVTYHNGDTAKGRGRISVDL